jgi:hypothetical protein
MIGVKAACSSSRKSGGVSEEESVSVSPRLRMLIKNMREEWRILDRRIAVLDDEFASSAKNDEASRRRADRARPRLNLINAG